MPKYVTRMAKSGESESYAVKDVGAREAITAEATARQQAVSDEASARETAVHNLQRTGAPDFDSSVSYKKGEFVYYNGALYLFVADKEPGEWNSSGNIVISTNVSAELNNDTNGIGNRMDYDESVIEENLLEIDKAVNIIHAAMFEMGFLNSSTGKPENRSVYNSRTGFIDLEENTNITYWRTDTGYSLYFYFYDQNKTFISRTTEGTNADGRITVPSNAKYVRIATWKADSTGLIDPYGNLVVTFDFAIRRFYSAPEYKEIREYSFDKIKGIANSSNLADSELKWFATNVSNDGKIYNIGAEGENWVSDYIDIGEGQEKVRVQYSRKHDNIQVYYYQYDADFEYLGTASIGKYNSFAFAPAEGAKYIRLKTWNNTYQTKEDCILFDLHIYASKNELTGYESKDIPKEKYVIPFKNIADNPYDPWNVPAYYYYMLQLRIETLMPLCRACRNNGDSFIFITDSHWNYNQKHSPAMIKYISKYLNIDKLFHGGDLADGVKGYWGGNSFDPTFVTYSIQQIKLMREAIDGKAFFTVGNHEYFKQSKDQDINYQLMTYLPESVVYGSVSRNYYYYDNTMAKVRYIVLNAYSYNGEDYSCGPGYEAEQRSWLQNTALDVPEGYLIIVISHCFYHFTDNTATSYVVDNQDVIDILNDYEGNGEIACLIQGHTHVDRIIETAPDGLKCVMTTCDKNITVDEGTNLDYRETGTDQEQAFDVVTLNRTSRTVTFTRIGGLAYDGTGENKGTMVSQRIITY